MDTFFQDLRFAARQLRRRPGFTGVAVLTLGIGIGATTSIFNVAEVALHRPLPFEHADRLVRVFRVPAAGTPWISLQPPTYTAVERHGGFFDAIVAQRYTTLTLSTDEGPEQMVGIAVTPGWAETLGVRPHLGRVFSPEEERLGGAAGVALLSYGAWRQRFGGDPRVLGRELVLDGRAHTVVGVMQRGLRYPYNTELWLPMRVDDAQVGPWSFNALARLRPGVSLEAAREELGALAADAARTGEAPALLVEGMSLTAIPFRELFVGEEARTTLALLGAVGFLLLIVCANLANLLLARGLNRERELALRASVGASRARLVRQLLTESALLGAVGSGLGILLAVLGGGLAQPLLPSRMEFFEASVTMNVTVLAFAVGLALVVTLLFGLWPALRFSSTSPGAGLLRTRGAAGDASSRRLGGSLVVAQVALGVVLLTGSGLILEDVRRLGAIDLGYEPAGLLTLTLPLTRAPYDDPAARDAVLTGAASELRSLPGVRAAGATSMFPSDRGNALAQLQIEGRDPTSGSEPLVNHRLVTPGFFEAVGIPLVAGRGILERDRADAPPVAVVSAAAARRFWPGGSPIGERIRSGEDGEWMTVVGVVGDVREFWDVVETWYLPYAQHADERSASSATIAVRSAGAGPPALAVVREALLGVAPGLPIVDPIGAPELHGESLTRQRQAAALGAAFAAFGLLLAALGLYGSVSYGVNRRRREFGIRMALGSERGRIVRDVLREGMRLVAIGTLLGAAGALAVTRVLAGVLDTIRGFEPASFAAAVLVLTTSAALAAVLPALRAARVDPAAVLREE